MIRKVLFLVLLAITSCKTFTERSSPKNLIVSEGAQVIFNLPDCLPQCKASDQLELAANSKVEAAYVEAIKNAKKSVNFSQFTFSRKPIFDALIEAASRGVVVKGVVDRSQLKTTGAFCQPSGCSLPVPYSEAEYISAPITARIERLQNEAMYKNGSMSDRLVLLLTYLPNNAGVKTAPGKERLVHNKFAIIDESRLLTGSGNWSSTAVSVNLENLTRFESLVFPDVLKAYNCMFTVVWEGDPNIIAKRLPACQVPGQVYFSPSGLGNLTPHRAISEAISGTRSKIDVAMHHLVDPEISRSLIEAHQRGVKVRIAVDDDDCNDLNSRSVIGDLEKIGVPVRYLPTTCSIFQLSHSKYGVFDGTYVINGSGNWSKSGLGRNYENFFISKELSGKFSDHFEWMWSRAVERSVCQCDRTEPACVKRFCLDMVPNN